MNNLALFGNPNTGKTSFFNMVTGSYEYVGNWAGVTVEKKVGMLRNKSALVTDLPGIYSINPLSSDETVATRFLLEESFSGMINIIDASQLERNLFLTIQLMEFGKPMLIALNMVDVAKGRGLFIDSQQLSGHLGVKVMPIVARTGKGCEAISQQLQGDWLTPAQPLFINYGDILEPVIERIMGQVHLDLPKRWLALQFLEGNTLVAGLLEKHIDPVWLNQLKQDVEARIKKSSSSNTLQHYIRVVRSEWIASIVNQVISRKSVGSTTLSDRIDAIVTNRFLGMPIFLCAMLLIFKLTFDWFGSPLSDLLDGFISGPITSGLEALLQGMGASAFIKDLALQGIIGGVGGVIVFVPQIFILFFMISFIEDSGYMARVAMVMDRLMESIGLNGKAFIPMIIGFGCNVPGIMAARTIEQPKERLLTILLTPLMSCSARLSVYSLFVGTFFVRNQSIVVFSLYILGIAIALLLSKLFTSTILKQESSMFFVELPPYRIPQWRTLGLSTWEKGKGFVKKAGTFIFGGSVFIWFLSYAGPQGLHVPMDQSFLAIIGGLLAPLLAPLGFGNWQAGAALLTGFLAKEVVVSTMNIIYVAPDMQALRGMMAVYFNPLQAFSFMAFVLLYVPCLATVAVISKETGSAKWTWFSVVYSLIIAYIVGLLIYQGGRILFGY